MGSTVFRRKSRFRNHCWILSVNCEILDLKNAFDFSKNLDFYLLNCTSYPTEGFKKRIIWLNSFFILIHLHLWIFTGLKYKFDSNFYYLCRVGLFLFSSLTFFLIKKKHVKVSFFKKLAHNFFGFLLQVLIIFSR